MKPTLHLMWAGFVLLSTLSPKLSTAFAQGTAFTYQGRLNDGAGPATGIHDLRFAIYDTLSNGTQVGGTLTNAAAAVANGLFTVTLDFGAGVFSGAERWLEIAARTNGAGAFSILSPRQAISPSPYAITARQVSGPVAASQLTGLISPSNIGGGAITGASLAPGAALASLQASGQAGVASGGIVLSATENPALVNAGYVKLDTMQSGNHWQARNASAGAPAPAARHGHSMIWTGREMIIWGGLGSGGYRNDGARYHPALNLWLPMSTVNAPTNRALHTAIWTGKEMIVWGGTAGETPLGDGGGYDPASNTWTPIPSSGAPSARSQHTAVWTGKEMIVWGGATNWQFYLNNGARYHPGTDVWTALPTEAAPTARRDHTAVWTGHQMILWGGSDAAGYVQDGGRYLAASNTWQSLPTAGAPVGREGHTAIWTGREMMIWGGANNAGLLRDGASCDTATGVWLSVSTADAPPVLRDHGAAWDGQEALISGGYSGGANQFTDAWAWTPGKVLFLYQKP